MNDLKFYIGYKLEQNNNNDFYYEDEFKLIDITEHFNPENQIFSITNNDLIDTL